VRGFAGVEEEGDEVGVELCSGVSAQFFHGLGFRHWGTPGRGRDHGVVCVGEREYACAEGDLVALEAVGISRAVIAFVVGTDELDFEFREGQFGHE